MKIITPRGNKDYNDYLTGIYGEGEKVVFDRRQYNVLSASDSIPFNSGPLPQDRAKQKIKIYNWRARHCHKEEVYIGRRFQCLLEVGTVHYHVLIERYLSEGGVMTIDWKMLEKRENQNHYGIAPLSFFLGGEVVWMLSLASTYSDISTPSMAS